MIDFRKIECFLKAAEKLNFSEAAKELYITPPALTHQIAQLEEDLGQPLFKRTTRKVSLTELGKFCQKEFIPLKNDFDKVIRAVTDKAKEQNPGIRVGFYNVLPKYEMVYPWLDDVTNACKGYSVEMISADRVDIRHHLENGTIDLCLTTIYTTEFLPHFRTETLLITPAKVVVSELHPWASKDEITLEDIAGGSMLTSPPPPDIRAHDFYHNVVCKKSQPVSDFDAMLAMLETGEYFAVFPPLFSTKEISRFKYLSLPKEYDFSFDVVCACLKSNADTTVHQVLDYIGSKAKEQEYFQGLSKAGQQLAQ